MAEFIRSMFFQLLFIHLFRPFLKYKRANSPLPAHISPRKFLLHSAATISKLLRLYRRTYGLRQICNIVVYIAHTACTVHLLNLPDKIASRDIIHGLNHLEEIAEGWLCARRTLGILYLVTKRWNIDLPDAAAKTFMRTETKFGSIKTSEHDIEQKIEDDHLMQQLPMQARSSSHTPPNDVTATYSMSTPLTPSFAPVTGVQQSPMSKPENSCVDESVSLPPQSALGHPQQSRQSRYIATRSQQEQWNGALYNNSNNRMASGPSPSLSTTRPILTSPTVMFGGVQGLMQDQEWWLRDSNQFCANWNHGIDGARMVGNGMNGNGINAGNIDFGNDDGSESVNGGFTGLNGFGLMDGHGRF